MINYSENYYADFSTPSDLRSLSKEVFKDNADFSPMSVTIPLKLEKIIHKAYIEVDKNGTKAGAATMGALECGAASGFKERKVVDLNRPFVYAIVHKKTQLPVFLGVVNEL